MKNFLKKLYVFLIFAFLYLPVIVMMVYSFNDSKSRAVWGGFTFKWYAKMFENSEIISALQVTLWVALASATIATIVGTLAAIGIHGMKKLPKTIIMNITYLPVLNPDIVTGISLMILYVFLGIPLGAQSLLLSHIVFNIPYVIISVLPKLSQIDNFTYEAAQDLGATPLNAYWRVIIPEILPGIVTGFLLAFTLSIDDFVISFFTSGVDNLPIYIYSATKKGVDPSLNALSTLMFVVIFTLLILVNKRSKKNNEA